LELEHEMHDAQAVAAVAPGASATTRARDGKKHVTRYQHLLTGLGCDSGRTLPERNFVPAGTGRLQSRRRTAAAVPAHHFLGSNNPGNATARRARCRTTRQRYRERPS
jgi:hypothetical protein